MKNRAAVIMATYNGEAWLTHQLDSIFQQSGVEISLFVSDDLSSDNTWPMLKSTTDSRLSLLTREHRFGSAGQNFFRLLRDVDFAAYDYVSLSDQDDVWDIDKLQRAIHLMQIERSDVVSSNVLAFWPNGETKLLSKSQPQTKWDHLFEAAGPGCTYVLSSEVALALQRFLRAHQTQTAHVVLHDWLIYAWTRHNGYRWSIDPRPSMRYRQHGNNQVGANTGWAPAKARFSKIKAGWYRDQALLIANLVGASGEKPIQLLARFKLADKFALVLLAPQLRRRWRDRFAFVIGIFLTKSRQTEI